MCNNPQDARPVPICSICNLPVPLSNAKTDEDGRAVHENCYLIKIGVAKPAISYPKPSSVNRVNAGAPKHQN